MIRFPFISTALIAVGVSVILAGHVWAERAAMPPQWERVSFSHPDDVVEYFHSINYSLANWQSGDRSVPRVYLTHVPSSWREQYADQLTTVDKKKYFFFMLAPMVLRANESIARQRAYVTSLRERAIWSSQEQQRLAEIAAEYGVNAPADPRDNPAFEQLLRRVDVVPASLAMAQAAIESGWGTSRFAAKGNALFGQWSWGNDAMAPERVRTELGNYGVRAFKTPFESITAYMHNLNTNAAYQPLRQARAQTRKMGKSLSGYKLAAGLIKYSERGQDYVDEVRALIRVNGLSETDKAYLRDVQPVMLEPQGADA